MRLSLDTREVGWVTIVRCNGRIVAGNENESLREHVTWLLRDRRAIVLHLGDVAFIDSSGLGTIVRSLTSTRQAHGDLKLCNVPDPVRKVLEMSHLAQLFDTHESEEKAVAAFYRPGARAETPARSGRSVLCLHGNRDVLAYVRELLRRAGYDVHSSNHLGDALLLMRVMRFDLLLIGPGIADSAPPAFDAARAHLPVIKLGSEFSTQDAGEAAAELLARVEAQFDRTTD